FEAVLGAGRTIPLGLSFCTTFVVYKDKKKIFSQCKACLKFPFLILNPNHFENRSFIRASVVL
ncbi:hypothetical protein, partial [Endozoicomonas sp. YOMI1]|uniref:hypothetical protein n=1 Tax=Endozoicomonas sp. YOMI1 TaxID=2828739 RepID=UPI002147C433